jgi:N-acetylmuramoyl-L-alanine amidase
MPDLGALGLSGTLWQGPFALTPLFRFQRSGCRVFLLFFFAVRRSLVILLFFLAATIPGNPAQQPAPQQPPSQPQAQPAQAPTPGPSPQAPVVALAPSVPEHRLNIVVLDAAHGGTDPGARGAAGAVEKDMVLIIARVVRIELERQGYRVVMTRDNDQNPSFEDRAALANAYRGAVFISFHVSSTGPVGTARVYSYEFSNPAQAAPSGSLNPAAAVPVPAPPGWTAWNAAQKSHADLSRRLADVLQVEMSQRFKGSPEISSAVAVRGLRSVAEPAVAVELSNVAVEDPKTVEGMASSLAAAIVRALAAFRPVYEGAR